MTPLVWAGPAVPGVRLKWTYVTRTMPAAAAAATTIGPHDGPARAGDLIVARVDRIGAHDHAEDPAGRRVRLYPGDLVVGAYGNRYATDFYEGYVPAGARTHLLTAGGLIGTVAAAHEAHPDPTTLEVAGRLVDEQLRPLSLEDFAQPLPPPSRAAYAPLTMAVLGTSMNAGKTTTAAALVRGFARAGFTPGAGKVTGSGSGKDRWSYLDAGAHALLDFLDFGMPSTFGYPLDRLGATMTAIREGLAGEGCDVVALEIADGLLQAETDWLARRLPGFADAVVFAAVDALSAHSGVALLREMGVPVRAVSGLVTRSPLAAREAAAATGLPVLSPAVLADGAAIRLASPEPVLS
jgi:hypothetical protein